MSALIDAHEEGSAAWQKVKAYYAKRLEQLRMQNDADLSPEKTAKLRGRIAEAKLVLGLDKEPPKVEPETPD